MLPLDIVLIFSVLTIAQQQAEDPNAFLRMLFVLAAFGLLFYFVLFRPHKKREEDMRRMVENVKENDRVITVGGIYGVVTNVQRDADRVTLRVDEATGTKIRVGLSAIARVLTDDKPTESRRDSKTEK